jgi:hypothetical protein
MVHPAEHGIILENGCRVTHGDAAGVKRPFSYIPLVMHELTAADEMATRYNGQLGFIPFTQEIRLPRHVHMSLDDAPGRARFLAERILVLHGVGLTELGGEFFVVAPGSLVDIAPGIPHTWTACPAGVRLPDGTISEGRFTMVYNYEQVTAFSPTRSTRSMTEAAEYERFTGDVAEIAFPKLSPAQVTEQGRFVWNHDLRRDLALA